MAGQPGLFDLDERYRALSESGDPLIRLATLIDFEVFRAPLVSALKRSDGTRGGRPPYDPVLMFKVVVLQTLYTLSTPSRMTPPRFASLPFGSDPRPPLVHALSWARAGASGSRCQNRLALPRAADAGGRDRGL